METKNLLLELGTEELPPKSLRKLAQALHDNFTAELKSQGLQFESSKWFATPRRLALYIKNLDVKQEDRSIEVRGPSVKVAFDANGNPTKAAQGWAMSNGIKVEDAKTLKTDKGEWLYLNTVKKGINTTQLVPSLFEKALKNLPIPKLMHWGTKKVEFVRPVHSLCMMFGEELIPGTILDLISSNVVLGHRFLGTPSFAIHSADSYVDQMWNEGNVMVDYDKRKAAIVDQIKSIASSVNGEADLDPDLVEEVTSIVEAPYIYKASFEDRFLQVPAEALVYTMKGDQKYFPIYGHDGKLLPVFAFVSNINPDDPSSLIAGNERVIRPRLSDAEFFFKTDRKQRLEDFYSRLESIVYQKDLGTIAERSEIVSAIAAYIADKIHTDSNLAKRAAHLSKCDLASTMVTEFTDTQGVMGYHYAQLDGENEDVAEAIFQAYQPRFAGDSIPTKPVQISVSLAEKIATLVGIFGINLLPKGDKDPFGLRRAAIGLIRIIIENSIDLDLRELIEMAVTQFGSKLTNKNTADNVLDYIFNRLKAVYQDQNVLASVFLSVLSVHPTNLLDFDLRIKAVQNFKALPAAENLAAAYKRINNILQKSQVNGDMNINKDLLVDENEQQLFQVIDKIKPQIEDSYAKRDYQSALMMMSDLREPVDMFFEHVMVNVDDQKIRDNRLRILKTLSVLFSQTADISQLY